MLSHQDSNLGKQNQNLMCYHYTMGQLQVKKESYKLKTGDSTTLFLSQMRVQKYYFFVVCTNFF